MTRHKKKPRPRVPVAKPGHAHKTPKDYDRQADKGLARREAEETGAEEKKDN
jgi:hypothetical protein